MSTQNTDKRIIIGVIFIALGLVFLLKNLGLVPFNLPYYLFGWEMIFMVVGGLLLLSRANKTPGIVFFTIGLFGMIDEIFDVSFWQLWPLILVIVGLSIIFQKKMLGRSEEEEMEFDNLDMDYIDEVAVFGGGEKKVNSYNFKGGKVTSIFGGSEVDLRNAQLSEGKNVIDVLTIFGGSTFYVPDDWSIKADVSSIFGAFTDSRSQRLKVVPDPDKLLIIKGFTMFGGGEIKN